MFAINPHDCSHYCFIIFAVRHLTLSPKPPALGKMKLINIISSILLLAVGALAQELRGPKPCPIPLCIAPCPEGKCADDEICEIKEPTGRCPLCPEFKRCKKMNGPPGEKCGDNRCPNGQVCCNASCGICTEPGGFCIQLACP